MLSSSFRARCPLPDSRDLAALVARCADEAIHVPGAVQPHGSLVAVASGGRIVVVSDNTQDVLGLHPTEILGLGLPDALGGAAAAELDAAKTGEVVALDLAAGAYEAIVHQAGALRLIEMERAPETDANGDRRLHQVLRRFHGARSASELSKTSK